MKWLLNIDEDIRTGFLLGTFFITFIVFFIINPWLMYISFIFPILWIYSLIKTEKQTKEKQHNSDSN